LKKALLLGVFLLLVVATVIACTSQKEAEYKKGIELIRQEEWQEASLALSLPALENYSHAQALQRYVNAKLDMQKGYIAPAAGTVIKIPDDYNGYFSEQVLAFKKEVLQKLTELTTEQINDQYKAKEYEEKQKSQKYQPGRS